MQVLIDSTKAKMKFQLNRPLDKLHFKYGHMLTSPHERNVANPFSSCHLRQKKKKHKGTKTKHVDLMQIWSICIFFFSLKHFSILNKTNFPVSRLKNSYLGGKKIEVGGSHYSFFKQKNKSYIYNLSKKMTLRVNKQMHNL